MRRDELALAIVLRGEDSDFSEPPRAALQSETSPACRHGPLAQRVIWIQLDAQCTGSVDRLWNVNLKTIQDAFKIIVAVASL